MAIFTVRHLSKMMLGEKSEEELILRKLRKKLRQVENLERLDRPLTEDESLKVRRKALLRGHLLEVLAQCSDGSESGVVFPQSTNRDLSVSLDTTASDEADEEEAEVEWQERDPAAAEYCGDDGPDVTQTGHSQVEVDESGDATKRESGTEDAKRGPAPATDSLPAKKAKLEALARERKTESSRKARQLKRSWTHARYQVRTLEGHSDLVCSVCLQGHWLLSAGRDTTVRLWNTDLGVEERSFGGHTGTVTSVTMLSQQQSQEMVLLLRQEGKAADEEDEEDLTGARYGLSGSLDCSVKLWALHSGHMVHSMYTFNPVTCLALMDADKRLLVVSGSDGGKVEVWEPVTGRNLHSLRAHEDAVTSIQVDGHFVYSSSADGVVKVYELRGETLHVIFESENVKTTSGTDVLWRHIRCLAAANQIIYYGDDGMNVKALDWKQGVVHKLSNHTTEFGITDAISCNGGLLCSTGYDLDNGLGFVNVRQLPGENYLCSLCDEDSTRIVCLDSCRDDRGLVTMATGGMELKVWRQAPRDNDSAGHAEDLVQAQYVPSFERAAHHSDADDSGSEVATSEGEVDGDEEEEEEMDEGRSPVVSPPFSPRRGSRQDDATDRGWLSWCRLV